MPSRNFLLLVERNLNWICRCNHRYSGEKQRVEHLLRYDIEGGSKAASKLRAGQALLDVQVDNTRSGEQEFSSEEVHLDLSTFAPAVVRHTVHADGRSLRCSSGINDKR